jgi:acyl-CoA dehydrogenase
VTPIDAGQSSTTQAAGIALDRPASKDPFETDERRALRDLTRRFTVREIVPNLDCWERAGEVPRELHKSAARCGLLGIGFPETAGGAGGDLLDTIVVTEEIIQSGGSSGLIAALFTHGIALPHIIDTGRPELIDRYVRPTLAGHTIGALAVTEPDGGSDVANIRTKATKVEAGYLINGAKTYITSGARADFVTTAVRTDDGIALAVVDRPTVTRRLEKMGWHCSDTAELAYVDVFVPGENLIPDGFALLMRHFATERISMAVSAYATAQRCLDLTIEWTRQRHTFGRALASRQLIRHRLAEMARQIDVARTYVRQTAVRVASGETLVGQVAMAKNTAVAACDSVVDQAVQLHGGLGYLRDAEVERHYRDARILGIGGGTTEIMNEIIAKQLGV